MKRHTTTPEIKKPLAAIGCYNCGGRMKITVWRPPVGFNPELRQYKCVKFNCQALTYNAG